MVFREGRQKKQGVALWNAWLPWTERHYISGNGTEHSKRCACILLRGRMAELWCNSYVVLPFYQRTECLNYHQWEDESLVGDWRNTTMLVVFHKLLYTLLFYDSGRWQVAAKWGIWLLRIWASDFVRVIYFVVLFFEKWIRTFHAFSFTLSCTVQCTSFVGTSAEIIFQHCERKKTWAFRFAFLVILVLS